jgi:hypothetical protein
MQECRTRVYLVIGGGKTAGARTGDGAITLFEPGRPRMYRVAMTVASGQVSWKDQVGV